MVSLFGSVANSLLGFGFIVLVSRTLSAPQAGGLYEAIAIFSIASYVTLLGADLGMLKTIPTVSTPRDRRNLSIIAILPSLVFCLAAAAVLIVYSDSLASLLVHRGNIDDAARELRIVSPLLPLSAIMTISLAGIRAWSVNESVMVQSIVVPLVRILLFGLFVILGTTPLLAAIAFSTPLGLGAVIGVLLLAAHLKIPLRGEEFEIYVVPRKSNIRLLAREFWKFSGPRGIGGAFGVLLAWLDIVLLGALGTTKQVAAYTLASRYIMIGTFALASMAVAIAPQLSRLWVAGKSVQAQTIYRESTWWIIAISWPPLMFMALFASPLLSVAGHDYEIAVPAMEILALTMLANAGTGNNSIAILMAGKSTVNLLIEGTSLGINVALNVILIPKIGLRGAAIAWSASIMFTAFTASAMLYRIKRVHPFGISYWAVVAATVLSFGLPGLLIRLILGANWASFAIAGGLCSSIYVGLLALFHRLGWLDLRQWATLIRRGDQ